MSSAPQNPSHLFISYASEDVVLATWLARKLASAGYAVWFDQIEMLGGEPHLRPGIDLAGGAGSDSRDHEGNPDG